jgi:putative spermidine/putrescine transport system permease protein
VLGLPLVLYAAVLFLVPLAIVIRASLSDPNVFGISGLTWVNYSNFLTHAYYWQVLLRTLLIAVVSVAATALLAVPYAYGLARRPALRQLQLLALFAPLLVNQVVRIFGLQILINSVNRGLGGLGLPKLPLTYNIAAVVLGELIFLFPYMAVSVFASLSRLDVTVEEAAATLGAPRRAIVWHVILPACRPGIAAGSVLTFASASGAYLVPQMMGGGKVTTVPVLIYNDVTQGGTFGSGAAAAVILMLVVIPAMLYSSTRAAR